jgi:hypothetical protein
MFTEKDLVYSYSTKQAIEDGFLVLIDQIYSLNSGVKIPVLFTIAAYEREVLFGNPPPTNPFVIKQRIESILNWYVRTVRISGPKRNPLLFPTVYYQLVSQLKAEIKAFDFDDPTPALFVMKPNED